MRFDATVQKANQVGTKKITIPKKMVGPNGDEIEVGDTIQVQIVSHEKPGDSDK